MISVKLLGGNTVQVDTNGLKKMEDVKCRLKAQNNIKYPFKMVGEPISNVVDDEYIKKLLKSKQYESYRLSLDEWAHTMLTINSDLNHQKEQTVMDMHRVTSFNLLRRKLVEDGHVKDNEDYKVLFNDTVLGMSNYSVQEGARDIPWQMWTGEAEINLLPLSQSDSEAVSDIDDISLDSLPLTLFSDAHSLASIGSPARSYVSTRDSLSDVRDPPYVMFNGVAVCPLIVTNRDNTVQDIIERAVCFVLRDELCDDRDIDHYTLEVNGMELSSDLFINLAINYINNFDDYELIYHETGGNEARVWVNNVMFGDGLTTCPLFRSDIDLPVKFIIDRAVVFVVDHALCDDLDPSHYTLEVNGMELYPEDDMHMALDYISTTDIFVLIHHKAIDINVKMIFDQGKVVCLPFHGTDTVDSMKHHIADLYDGLDPDEIRIAYRSDYLDDDEEIRDIFSGNADPFLYASVGGPGGGKRKLEDRMVDAHNLVSKNEAAVSPDNQFMTQLQNLHAFVYNNQNVFEEFLKVIPANLAQKLSDAWYGSDQTNVDRLVEIIWNCLCTDYASIQKVEKDANEARKVITSLLTLAYLKQFPDTNGSNCEHETFQAMIDKKMEDFEREVEIQRRVNERLQQQNVQIDDPDL